MNSEIRLDFQLFGTAVSPAEITRSLGIKPDVQLLRGERDGSKNLPRQNIWSLESKVDSENVTEIWASLSLELSPKVSEIKSIAETGSAVLTIVIKCTNRIPSIVIPTSMAEFAGAIGATIDIDHLQF
jgi:Domain of unknown function (DUF4279)